jgi:hypothetical protein
VTDTNETREQRIERLHEEATAHQRAVMAGLIKLLGNTKALGTLVCAAHLELVAHGESHAMVAMRLRGLADAVERVAALDAGGLN